MRIVGSACLASADAVGVAGALIEGEVAGVAEALIEDDVVEALLAAGGEALDVLSEAD